MPTPKAEDKRSALLQAALQLFAKQGFDGTSTALIAKRAGVASGTLFFHFKNKEELIHELFRELSAKFRNRILESFPAEMSPRDRLLRTLANMLRYFLENPEHFKFLEHYYFSPLGEQAIRDTEEKQTILQLLEETREHGLIKDVPLLVLEAIVFGPVTALAREHANRGTPIDETICRLTIEACWDAIRI